MRKVGFSLHEDIFILRAVRTWNFGQLMIEQRTLGKLVIRDALGFHGSVIDESILLRHDGASRDQQLPCFRRSPVWYL